MKTTRPREKSNSLRKSTKGQTTGNLPKAHSTRQLPKWAIQSSSGKKTTSKEPKQRDTKRKPYQQGSTIEQRVANIKKGFVELQRKLFSNQSQKQQRSFNESEIKRYIGDSASKSSRKTRKDNSHHCVYQKAVFNLIAIIEQQKGQLDQLKRQIATLRTKHQRQT